MPTIAFIMQAFYGDRIGGAERQVQLLGEGLRDQGWRTVYICERPVGKPRSEVVLGMEVIALPLRQKRNVTLNYKALKEAMRESRADLFYQRIRHPYTGMGVWAARKLKKPFVWAAASTADLDRRVDYRNPNIRLISRERLAHPVNRRIESWGIHKADAVILQTMEQLRLLETNYHRSGTVIPNHIVSCTTAEAVPRRQPPEVLWLSNIKSFKRPELFIALARRCQDMPVRFTMVGGCMNPAALTPIRSAQESVPNFAYIGPLSPAEAEERIAGATVLVNTSLFEGFPNAFQQAWCYGVPTLTMNADPDGIINREKLGSACASLEDLEVELRKLLGSAEIRDKIAIHARSFAHSNYELSGLLPAYLKLFNELLQL